MTKENHPLVSIVIPVYNGSNYLREAIDSALAQTYDNVEILVINDGSADNGATHDIAMSYGKKIRYFQKENGGVVSALNFGIDNMHGEYFSWLSHDDLYLPEKIEKQVSALKNHKGTKPAFCVCNCLFINENGEELYKSIVNKECAFENPRCFLFLGNVGFNGIMVLIPKTLFDICGKFTPSLATHEYDMWIRLMNVADVVVEEEYLSVMRMHVQQVSNERKIDASKEIDNFMGNGVENISSEEFQVFIETQINAKSTNFILELLIGYMWYQNLPLTATQTLKKLREMFYKPIINLDSIYSKLLGHSNIDEFKTCVLESQKSDKPIVAVYCENITDSVIREISIGLALLAVQSDVVLFYHSSEVHQIDLLQNMEITPILVENSYYGFVTLQVAMLTYLTNAKFLWLYTYAGNDQHYQMFHYLDVMKIYSVASYYEINEYNMSILSGIEMKHNMSRSSLLTCKSVPSEFGTHVFKNLITVPNDDLKLMLKWKKIFDLLLSVDEYFELDKLIETDLAIIIEKEEKPFDDYVEEYIKKFIIEVNIKEAELIKHYEERTFWKMTKVLRTLVYISRKFIKAIKYILRNKMSIRDILYHIRVVLKNRRLPS